MHTSFLDAGKQALEKSSQLFQDPSWSLWISTQVSTWLLNLSSSDHNVESVICDTQIVISDNSLHLSIEPSDGVDRSLICAVTVELHHHPHPRLEGSLRASSNASWMLLSLKLLLPHFTSLFAVNMESGAEPR